MTILAESSLEAQESAFCAYEKPLSVHAYPGLTISLCKATGARIGCTGEENSEDSL